VKIIAPRLHKRVFRIVILNSPKRRSNEFFQLILLDERKNNSRSDYSSIFQFSDLVIETFLNGRDSIPMPKTTSPLSHLITLSARLGGDTRLKADLTLAVQAPAKYFDKYRERMAQWDFEGPVTDLAWTALLDGLEERKKLWKVDWREHPKEVAGILKRLGPKTKAVWTWITPKTHALGPQAFLKKATNELVKRGWALLSLTVGEDTYALVILPTRHKNSVIHIAQKAGYSIATADKALQTRQKRRLYKTLPRIPVDSSQPVTATATMWRCTQKHVGHMTKPNHLANQFRGFNAKPGERMLAWARVMGWRPNFKPASVDAPAPANEAVVSTHKLGLWSVHENSIVMIQRIGLKNIKTIHILLSPNKAVGLVHANAQWPSGRKEAFWFVAPADFIRKFEKARARWSRIRHHSY
jgi:hypothetical protein